jgi:hypothetical protein
MKTLDKIISTGATREEICKDLIKIKLGTILWALRNAKKFNKPELACSVNTSGYFKVYPDERIIHHKGKSNIRIL